MLVQDLSVKMGETLYPIRNIKSNKIGLVDILLIPKSKIYRGVPVLFSHPVYNPTIFFKHLPKFKATKDPFVFFKDPESWLSG